MSKYKWSAVVGAILMSGCQVQNASQGISNASPGPTGSSTSTIKVTEAYPMNGSEKITVHAFKNLSGNYNCANTVSIRFTSPLNYSGTLIALRNRAMITGANALAITGLQETASLTSMTAHFYDCNSKEGLNIKSAGNIVY